MPTRQIAPQVAAALFEGRKAYKKYDYNTAARADRRALELATAQGDALGQVRALRLIGLCEYRRGRLEASLEALQQAQARAETEDFQSELLLVSNHLGATLRKLGRLDAADTVFRTALRRAKARHQLDARARLLGSYGAFLDDLGDREAAAEQYARHEELVAMLNDPVRLASAHGLVSRANRLRGNLAAAEEKARQERDLGAKAKNPHGEGRGWMHLGQALGAGGKLAEAEKALLQANTILAGAGDVRTPVRIATALGSFYLEQGHLQEAHQQLLSAQRCLGMLSDLEQEHRASVSLFAARLASSAGLHGAALWHMEQALESHWSRFEPIADPSLQALTQHRRQQLVTLAEELQQEAGVVDRDQAETHRIDQLLARLRPHRSSARTQPGEVIRDWRRRVRDQAQDRWRRLLPGAFDNLSDGSRSDLVLADVVSQGPVGDLSRSLFLMFGIIERELNARVIAPLQPHARDAAGSEGQSSLSKILREKERPPGLGHLARALTASPEGVPTRDPLHRFLKQRYSGKLRKALGGLLEVQQRVDGQEVPSPVNHRNAIAHGRSLIETRMDADAVRSALTLGPSATLLTVAALATLSAAAG